MAGEFNPYREWLGLGTDAPNYYELLGLALHEGDLARIAAAADRSITRVRSFRPGPQARAWAQLLDELREAKECLTNDERKASYDADLKRGLTRRPLSVVECEIATLTPVESLPVALPVPMSGREQAPPIDNVGQSWASGPSPVYLASGPGKPSDSAMAMPVAARDQALPEAPPVAREPRTSIGIPEPRPVFVAAGKQPDSKATVTTKRRKSGWLGWVFIGGLTLLTIGLSYRLSVVARQRQAAEKEAEAKQLETQAGDEEVRAKE